MSHIRQTRQLKLIPVALILAPITLTGCSRRVVSEEQVENLIEEPAPIGSDKQQVREFVDILKIDSLKIGRGVDFDRTTELTRESHPVRGCNVCSQGSADESHPVGVQCLL